MPAVASLGVSALARTFSTAYLPASSISLAEIAAQVGGHRGYLTQINLSRRAVERNPVTLLHGEAVHADRAGFIVDLQLAGARYAAFAHAACDDGRVRRHAAACGQDTCRVEHALEVLRRGFDADEDRFLARLCAAISRRLRRRTPSGPVAAPGDGGQTLGDDLGALAMAFTVEYGVQQLVEFGRLACAARRCVSVDQTLARACPSRS